MGVVTHLHIVAINLVLAANSGPVLMELLAGVASFFQQFGNRRSCIDSLTNTTPIANCGLHHTRLTSNRETANIVHWLNWPLQVFSRVCIWGKMRSCARGLVAVDICLCHLAWSRLRCRMDGVYRLFCPLKATLGNENRTARQSGFSDPAVKQLLDRQI